MIARLKALHDTCTLLALWHRTNPDGRRIVLIMDEEMRRSRPMPGRALKKGENA